MRPGASRSQAGWLSRGCRRSDSGRTGTQWRRPVRFLRRAGSLVVWASLSILACVCCLRTAHGQSLDVASVKPSAPDVSPILCNGGPGTRAPRVWRCGNMPLALVIQRAFHFQEFQFSSHAPCCLGRFDFDVRLPEGAARDEFDRMLQNLLRERFKLAFHYGTKEMSEPTRPIATAVEASQRDTVLLAFPVEAFA